MDDFERIERVKQGDERAFREIVEAHQESILNLCMRYLGSAEDAEEIAQDVFIKGYDQLQSLKDPAKFGPWLSRITSRLAIDRLRVRKKSVSLPELGPVEDTLSHGPGSSQMTLTEKENVKYKNLLQKIQVCTNIEYDY